MFGPNLPSERFRRCMANASRIIGIAHCFGGNRDVYEHASTTLGVSMRLRVYLPPLAQEQPCPVVYWLSELTFTEQNFITKAGAQRVAAILGIILVTPDTSPRGHGVPGDPEH